MPSEGGNHAQFGNYGPQKGDLPATISTEEQQAQTVTAIEAFIEQQIIQHGQEEPISHE